MPRAVLNMLRRLKQGMGRGIRKAGDVVCVWICDPRFGMPADLAAAHMLPQHPKSKPVFFAVVERRFRAALTAAEIIPLPESLTGPGHAALEVA
jgi:Rad3-related DNA helicase